MKIVLRNIGWLSLVLVLFTCANAQINPTKPMYTKVMPGDRVIDASKIKPDEGDFAGSTYITGLTPNTLIGGPRSNYNLQIVEKDGKEVLRMQKYYLEAARAIPGWFLYDTIYFNKETLAFIGRKVTNRGYSSTIEVEFADGKLVGNYTPREESPEKPYKYNESYGHTFFEFSMLQYLIAALPLKDCYSLSVPVIYLNNNGSDIHWVNIIVLGSEEIETKEKTYDTWKVLATTQTRKEIFLIDKTERTTLKTLIASQTFFRN